MQHVNNLGSPTLSAKRCYRSLPNYNFSQLFPLKSLIPHFLPLICLIRIDVLGLSFNLNIVFLKKIIRKFHLNFVHWQFDRCILNRFIISWLLFGIYDRR